MKDVLKLFTFAVGALCLAVFVAVFEPDAFSAVPGASKPGYCKAEAWPKDGCRQQVLHAQLRAGLCADRSGGATTAVRAPS